MPRSKRSRAAKTPAIKVDLAPLAPAPFNATIALFGLEVMHANLATARNVFDTWRAVVRTQQDAMWDAFETAVCEAVPTECVQTAPAAAKCGVQANGAPHDAHWKNRHGALDAFE